MNPRLHSTVTSRLLEHYQFKEEKGFLRKGVCPNCGKKELYTSAEHPWVLRCGRLDKCGWEGHVKDLYADLFQDWSRNYPVTPADPHAAADAYLRDGRGFDLQRIKGWYRQESYWNQDLNAGSATVRFPLGELGYWERIIDRPYRFGKRKATFHGSYKGHWWQAPGQALAEAEEIWITEGIFDAIALMHVGITAVSALSCNNYPDIALGALAEQKPLSRPRLVFAFDTGAAGEDFTRKFVARAIREGWEATAAQPPAGRTKLDWNELLQRDRLTDKHIEEYRYFGALLLAATPAEKASLIYSRHGWNQFPFDHDFRLYWWKLDLDKLTKVQESIEDAHPEIDRDKARQQALMQSNTVVEICNCLPTPLYYLKNEVTDEAWYYFRISFPHDGKPVKNTFSAGQLSAAAEFKKRLLHSAAGAIYTGSGAQLDRLLSRWTFNLKTVETVDFIGYSKEHKAYVYNDTAVQGDRVAEINEEDYFDLGKLAIKSLSRSLKLDINRDLKAPSPWFDRFVLCFGPRGLVALAAWFGALFAEQIRERFESFPFVEIVGEPGSGKTTLLETMWKLVGRTGYEGFDPMKSSQVGFMRAMAQVSNLPVVLIESDRDQSDASARGRPAQAFHWDSLKSLYNGGSLRTTGVKSSGNDTYDPQFRAALIISQNAQVQASLPIMERIVHIEFDKSRQSEAGREAALELGRMPARDLSSFLVRAITKEAAVLALMEERLRGYEQQIAAAGSRNQRIQKNHAQLMVCLDALSMACPITPSQQQEARELITAMAVARESALARDNPLVEAFWEIYDYLEDSDEFSDGLLNHSRDATVIAISLPHFEQVCGDRKLKAPPIPDLKGVLRSSRQRKFLDVRTVNSRLHEAHNKRVLANNINTPTKPLSVKCWLFEA